MFHNNLHEALWGAWAVGRPGAPMGSPCPNLVTGLDSPSHHSASFNSCRGAKERHIQGGARPGYRSHHVISA